MNNWDQTGDVQSGWWWTRRPSSAVGMGVGVLSAAGTCEKKRCKLFLEIASAPVFLWPAMWVAFTAMPKND